MGINSRRIWVTLNLSAEYVDRRGHSEPTGEIIYI